MKVDLYKVLFIQVAVVSVYKAYLISLKKTYQNMNSIVINLLNGVDNIHIKLADMKSYADLKSNAYDCPIFHIHCQFRCLEKQ